MRGLYTFLIVVYHLVFRIVAPFNDKARSRLKGLRRQRKTSLADLAGNREIIWMHCASAGEFEQGKPLFEELKKAFPEDFFLLTFFSPSGFYFARNYSVADRILYLPFDYSSQFYRLIEGAKFRKVFFIKYEFWYNLLSVLKEKNIPVYLVSAVFRSEQVFFRPYGRWFLQQLTFFKKLFVQDPNSAELIKSFGLSNVLVCGDTRADRVLQVSKYLETSLLPEIDSDSKVIVCGSIYKVDYDILKEVIRYFNATFKWVLVPHEIDMEECYKYRDQLSEQTGLRCVLLSDKENNSNWDIIIVDAVGYLSGLYKYGYAAYVGGGFGKGIHNVLEPSAASIPVFFGPNFKKFREAGNLIASGGGFVISASGDAIALLEKWVKMPDEKSSAGLSALSCLEQSSGACRKIMEEIVKLN